MWRLVVVGICLSVTLLACTAEERIVFDVDTTSDSADTSPGDDICSSSAGCSLRAALQEAAAGDKKSININVPAGTYLLEEGELSVEGKVISIQGENRETTIVDAQGDSRVFNIKSGLVTLRAMTIQNGDSLTSNGGGGVRVSGSSVAALSDLTVQNNDGYFRGGGLYVDTDAVVTLQTSLIRQNKTGLGGGGGGGGLFNAGRLTISDSTISDNEGGNAGGGLGHSGERLNIGASTISNNRGYRGGMNLSGPTSLSNVTVSGNQELQDSFRGAGGWGITITDRVSFRNVTVTNNGNTNAARTTPGGGVQVASGGSLSLQNSLIASNRINDCTGSLTSTGFNLIGDASTCSVSAATGDQLGTAASRIPAGLADLADNGGPTRTHALLPDSSAVDAGSNLVVGSDPGACLSTDQRNVVRPQDGDSDGPILCDIGAFELEP